MFKAAKKKGKLIPKPPPLPPLLISKEESIFHILQSKQWACAYNKNMKPDVLVSAKKDPEKK